VSEPRILIIGAGPTGLGAAVRLTELGHRNFTVYERGQAPGGLASSIRDEHGFVWDLGGHVLDSHYRYFDRFLDRFLGEQVAHQRSASIWVDERLVPYPIQHHLSHLSPALRRECLDDLRDCQNEQNRGDGSIATFGDWLHATFGAALCRLFMVPYNEKIWAAPVETLDSAWVAHRVPKARERAIAAATTGNSADSWGPGLIRYPRVGGTGSIWRRAAQYVGTDHLVFDTELEALDAASRLARLSDGRIDEYDFLISTVPLDLLIAMMGDDPQLAHLGQQLRRTSTSIVGIGLSGPPTKRFDGASWLYFPQRSLPFHRVVALARFSPENVPDARRHWSLMAELSASPDAPLGREDAIEATLQGFRECGLLDDRNRVESQWATCLDHGYPTPFLGRDKVLDAIHPVMAGAGIFSRGRFGGWKFEVSDQDHSVMQGVEVVNRILFSLPETTYWFPEVVNSSQFRLAQ
jgi:protoporphyrinogen oxidase